MRIEGDFLWVRFVGRKSRFLVSANLNGEPIDCFMANPGRLKEILIPGMRLLVKRAFGERKTGFDVVGACIGERIVTLDTRFANALVKESLKNMRLPELQGYDYVRSEPSYGSGRFDFLLDPPCFIEVKSCTVAKDDVALFPDAPTNRGRGACLPSGAEGDHW